jgi:hypothetical protein
VESCFQQGRAGEFTFAMETLLGSCLLLLVQVVQNQ